MARPIEATPRLEGDEAEALLKELEHVASPEEMERRRASAQQLIDRITRRIPQDPDAEQKR